MVLEKTLMSPLNCKKIHQSILKEISPGCSLEGLMLKLKVQYFGHLMQSWFIGKDLDVGRNWGQEEKGTTEDEMAGWHHRLSMDVSLSELRGVGDGQGGLVLWFMGSQRVRHDWMTEMNNHLIHIWDNYKKSVVWPMLSLVTWDNKCQWNWTT